MASIYGNKSPIELPIYSVSETAHHLGLPRSTVNAWVSGQPGFESVILVDSQESRILSFRNLVEIYNLSALKDYGVRLPAVRKAIRYLRDRFNTDHPLADQKFFTDGHNVFIKKYGEIVDISNAGQLAMSEVMSRYLKRVVRDKKGLPVRLYPRISSRVDDNRQSVSIDPQILFGQPCLAGTRIPTSVIGERYKAGDSISDLMEDYGCTAAQIEDALRYEFPIRAA